MYENPANVTELVLSKLFWNFNNTLSLYFFLSLQDLLNVQQVQDASSKWLHSLKYHSSHLLICLQSITIDILIRLFHF